MFFRYKLGQSNEKAPCLAAHTTVCCKNQRCEGTVFVIKIRLLYFAVLIAFRLLVPIWKNAETLVRILTP